MERALIDTSILLEPFTPWKNNEPNYKQSCLALLRGGHESLSKKFTPVVSLSVMGEFHLVTKEKRSVQTEPEKMLTIVDKFFKATDRVGLTRETLKLCSEILLADPRLDPLDALHLATAITENCQTLFCIDYRLQESMWFRGYLRSKGVRLTPFNIPENRDTKRVRNLFR